MLWAVDSDKKKKNILSACMPKLGVGGMYKRQGNARLVCAQRDSVRMRKGE